MTGKVTIIEKPGLNGFKNLALEYSPAIISTKNGAAVTEELLVHKIYAYPGTEREIRFNRVMLEKADYIRQYRQEQLDKGELHIYEVDERNDFMAFYRRCALERKGGSTNYTAGYSCFENFMIGKCTFKEVDEALFVRYREYLLSRPMGTPKGGQKAKQLSYSTVKGYFDQFRYILTLAFQKGFLDRDLHDCAECIHEVRVVREYISDAELQKLNSTPCPREDVPLICRFLLLTGLRYSDIKKMKWEDLIRDPSGRICLKRTLQLTRREELFYLSDEAVATLGKRGKRGPVFMEEVEGLHNKCLKAWAKDAGIKRNITFEYFRRNIMEPSTGA